MEAVHPNLQYNSPNYGVEVLMENLGFSDIEKRIIRSRLSGQKISEFLKENKDITNAMYSNALKKMKQLVLDAQEEGTW